MFGGKPREPRTIADAMILKKRLVFTCKACGAIMSKEPNELFFKPNMEFAALERISVCTECGAGNVTSRMKQLFLTVED